jgi:hypothetical protein
MMDSSNRRLFVEPTECLFPIEGFDVLVAGLVSGFSSTERQSLFYERSIFAPSEMWLVGKDESSLSHHRNNAVLKTKLQCGWRATGMLRASADSLFKSIPTLTTAFTTI